MRKLKTQNRSFTADRARVLAIGMVVLCHLRYLTDCPQTYSTLVFYFNSGVDVFFALSGFLITKKYIEKIKSIKTIFQFYVRRWIRTLPLYLLFAIVYLAFQFPDLRNVVFYLTFTQNYFSPNSWYISWSLCVEEWFYLLYAPIVYLLKRTPFNLSFSLLLLSLASLLFRLYTYHNGAHDFQWFKDNYYGLTHLRFDGLLIGCFFGSLKDRKTNLSLKAECIFPIVILILSIAPTLYMNEVSRIDAFSAAYLPFITATLTSCWLWFFWNSQYSFCDTAVETVSRISYSAYLVHLPSITLVNKLKVPFIAGAPLALLFIIFLSMILYFKFETLFLKRSLLQPR